MSPNEPKANAELATVWKPALLEGTALQFRTSFCMVRHRQPNQLMPDLHRHVSKSMPIYGFLYMNIRER
jgi:hypothetical protein